MSEVKKSGRAPLSSVFALIGAIALLTFVIAVTPQDASSHEILILVWAAGLAVALLIWAARALPGKVGVHWIGHPTLGMIAGVSGGTIAAVALVLSLQSGREQEKLLRKQLEALTQLESKLESIRTELITLSVKSISPGTPKPTSDAPTPPAQLQSPETEGQKR
jgi:hypothetical protein